MTNTPTQAEIELRRKIYANVATATRSENSSLGSMTVDEATDQIMSLIQTYTQVVEKAYGGCRNCYGKGYATVNDRWIGHDTDTDIGSPGGTITGGNPNAMKFCSCERGKQLEKQFQAAEVQARVDERTKIRALFDVTEFDIRGTMMDEHMMRRSPEEITRSKQFNHDHSWYALKAQAKIDEYIKAQSPNTRAAGGEK